MIAAVIAFLGYTGVMVRIDRRLKSRGSGIVAFELAGTAERAEHIMASWGHEGRRDALASLRLDFGYMLTYGTVLALLVDRVRRRHDHPAALPWLAVPAVAADAVEGMALLKVLQRNNIDANARRARTAALIKFGILAVGLGYAATWPCKGNRPG
ncbi:hypothetical protein [Mycolicibacterium septicum]|uniref:hypothetical protein n=1 Tax=Mycolicibacterium septicum TaxID=98668 RepID=UPI0023624074|nr:hypothetical protein [Mycolicibacterium septicum]